MFMQTLRRREMGGHCPDILWHTDDFVTRFRTAISLHSHTHHSREGLDFIPRVLGRIKPAQIMLRALENEHRRVTGRDVPYDRVFWRPPLNPKAAYELESGQIRKLLDLQPLVSITDHDNLEACADLRAVGIEAPYSFEWTVPYGSTVFHIGVHNLPADDAFTLFHRMAAITANPTSAGIAAILRDLDAMPDVLLVLNHPLSNEARTTFRNHVRLLQLFLREHVHTIHALELNGLQPARNNRRVAEMAEELGLPVISGGDRHCLEPNANVNLTDAGTFTEFVHEIRRELFSRVLFLSQYREATSCRYVEFIAQAVARYPELTGRERWVDRVFLQTDSGESPLSAAWPRGGPWPIRAFVSAVGIVASQPMRPTLRLALRAQSEVRA
jgi:hypothetical protein